MNILLHFMPLRLLPPPLLLLLLIEALLMMGLEKIVRKRKHNSARFFFSFQRTLSFNRFWERKPNKQKMFTAIIVLSFINFAFFYAYIFITKFQTKQHIFFYGLLSDPNINIVRLFLSISSLAGFCMHWFCCCCCCCLLKRC